MNGTTHYISVVNAARETVGKMLTQRKGQSFQVKVTTEGGKTANALRIGDSCVVNLPSLAPDTVLTRAEADRMLAYIVHEVCHLLHTDYAAWGEAVKAGTRVRYWANALEDVRIEELEKRVGPYKAMDGLIAGLVQHLYVEAHTALAAEGTTLGESASNAPYILTVLGRAANGYPLPITSTLHGSLSPKVRTIVNHALAGVQKCTSTTDCLTLAHKLVALEGQGQGQGQDQDQDQGQDGQEGQSQDGQKGQGEGQGQDGQKGQGEGQDGQEGQGQGQGQDGQEGQGQGQGQDGQKGQGEGQGQDGQKGQGEGQGQDGQKGQGEGQGQDGQKGQSSEGQGIEPDLNLGDTAEKITQRTGQRADKYDGAHRLNQMTVTRGKIPHTAKPHKGSCDTLNKLIPPGGVLHGQISRLLVSETRTAVTHHETSGRLDRRALVRMGTGAQDVYSRRDYAPGIDTAVLVLIDLSGSMGGRIHLARATAWALARAAESAGGKLAIAGFIGEDSNTKLLYVKGWNDSADQCAQTLCAIIPTSYTPLSASIIAGAADLAEVSATRRILLVLTDGQCDLGASAVQSACRLASSIGVETVGIGIQCEEVTNAFPARYSVNVNDLDQLAKTGLGTLARMLEETGGR